MTSIAGRPVDGGSGRDRAALALDVVVAASLVLAVLRVVELIVMPGQVIRTALYIAVLVAVVGLWLAWRRETRSATVSERRLSIYAVAFVVLTTSLFFIGDEPSGLPLFVVGLIMVQRRYGLRGGAIVIGALVFAQAVLFLVLGRGWAVTGAQALSSLALFGFSLLVAWLFAEIDRQRRNTAALAVEVERQSGMEAELASIRERQRSARDLHDGIGHQITVIMMSLQFAERMRERDPDRAWAEVSTAREQATAALADIRRLARALHPTGLGSAGAADLSALASSFAGTGLSVSVADEEVGLVLPDDLAVFRQRFVQEALTNVVRHAGATAVTVSQRVVDHRLVLAVADNGSAAGAVVPGAVVPGAVVPGFGLGSLAERAAELGGTTEVITDSAGWTITATVPCRPATRS